MYVTKHRWDRARRSNLREESLEKNFSEWKETDISLLRRQAYGQISLLLPQRHSRLPEHKNYASKSAAHKEVELEEHSDDAPPACHRNPPGKFLQGEVLRELQPHYSPSLLESTDVETHGARKKRGEIGHQGILSPADRDKVRDATSKNAPKAGDADEQS